MKAKLHILCTLVAIGGFLTGQARANLVTNGDFQLGNAGFATGYTLATSNSNLANGLPDAGAGYYAILSYPTQTPLGHPSFDSFFDHTLGTSSGLMFVANGAEAPVVDQYGGGTTPVWSQQINVTQDTVYNVSAWLANAYTGSSENPAILQFMIGSTVLGTKQASNTPVWQEFTATWQANTNGPVTLSIVDLNTYSYGNDFALDDISVSATPEPGFYALLGLGLSGLAVIRRKLTKNS